MFSFDEIFGKGGHEQPQHKIAKTYKLAGREIREDKLISEGAFGYIWKAVDTNTGQVYALKRVICTNSERLEAAKHELEVMKKMKPCANLVGFYGGDLVRESNSRTVVIVLMEMCDSGTLFDEMVSKQDIGFKEDHLLRIVDAIARGIAGLHAIGYAHRDIKIENVLRGKDGNYKLCDFGSCTSQIVDFSAMPQSQYGHYEDELEKNTTPMYRPPEIVDPFLKYRVSEKVDVWMLGCVLYTLCYFVHPFIESNKLAISRGLFKIPTDSKFKYSAKLNDLIRHMLTPNPQNRPSINDVLTILRNWGQLSEVPLNHQAKALKAEQQKKAKEMEALDKKAVNFDGDIPIEELMKLQKKLEKGADAPVTSFVNAKPGLNKSTSAKVPVPTVVRNPPLSQTQSMRVDAHSNDFDFFNFGAEKKPAQQSFTTQQPVKKPSQNDDLWSLLNDPQPSASKSQQQKTTNVSGDQFDVFKTVTQSNTAPKEQKYNSKSKDFDLFVNGFQQPPEKPSSQANFNFF